MAAQSARTGTGTTGNRSRNTAGASTQDMPLKAAKGTASTRRAGRPKAAGKPATRRGAGAGSGNGAARSGA